MATFLCCVSVRQSAQFLFILFFFFVSIVCTFLPQSHHLSPFHTCAYRCSVLIRGYFVNELIADSVTYTNSSNNSNHIASVCNIDNNNVKTLRSYLPKQACEHRALLVVRLNSSSTWRSLFVWCDFYIGTELLVVEHFFVEWVTMILLIFISRYTR